MPVDKVLARKSLKKFSVHLLLQLVAMCTFTCMVHTELYLSDLIEYVVYGTVIQEVKTSNIAREVGIHRIHHYFLEH